MCPAIGFTGKGDGEKCVMLKKRRDEVKSWPCCAAALEPAGDSPSVKRDGGDLRKSFAATSVLLHPGR